ncbi:hypothetical protein PG987_011167 [Apiospora arundinis]
MPDMELPTRLTSEPPPVADAVISFPTPYILQLTLNRPKALNAFQRAQHFALHRLWGWYDAQPSLRCAIITGTGRAFSAGADLKEWEAISQSRGVSVPPLDGAASHTNNVFSDDEASGALLPPGGFGGISNRDGKKPILAAVNGICFGGGMEIAINCDMVIAADSATFGLPEVTVGVIALAGSLTRIVRSVGRQRATEMVLSGKSYSAEEMRAWGLVNEIVDGDGEAVLQRTLMWAERIAANSPDAVIASREGLKLAWEGVGPQEGTASIIENWYSRIDKGDNMMEGMKSFIEKRKPVWKDSDL